MTIIDLLRTTKKSVSDSNAPSAMASLHSVFPDDEWGLDCDLNYYSDDNVSNLWKNELRKRIKNKLTAAGKSEGDYKQWLGDVHFVNINAYRKSLFDKYRSNAGWRIVIMSIPRAGVLVLGIASHYQNAQNHKRLGEVSNLLYDVAKEAIENDAHQAMYGRKITSADWDHGGLISQAITSIDSVAISDVAPDGLHLKDIRTTTLKRILASFISIQIIPSSATESQLLAELTKLSAFAKYLSEKVYPFSGLEEFETLRALALQDLAAAGARLQLRRKSSTRSIVKVYFGPPGTGKTLTAVREAVKLVEPTFDAKGDLQAAFEKFNALREQCAFITFHPSLQYEDLVESIRPVVSESEGDDIDEDEDVSDRIKAQPGQLGYRVHEGILLRMIRRALEKPGQEFVLVIDEINRGDLSRILGPLISTLEADKRIGAEFPIGFELQYPRAEELESRLFLPSNLHFLGTMNSSDRNIALVDHALRRRFDFVEVPPEPNILTTTSDTPSINCARLLERINQRIEHLIDADHCVGHGYFVGCDTNLKVIERMVTKVIPLLREYFYGNDGLMLLVFGDAPGQKQNIFQSLAPEDQFAKIFTIDQDIAISMGYRPHTAPRNLRLDERFWNASRLIPGPNDEGYAVECIRKIYDPQANSPEILTGHLTVPLNEAPSSV